MLNNTLVHISLFFYGRVGSTRSNRDPQSYNIRILPTKNKRISLLKQRHFVGKTNAFGFYQIRLFFFVYPIHRAAAIP